MVLIEDIVGEEETNTSDGDEFASDHEFEDEEAEAVWPISDKVTKWLESGTQGLETLCFSRGTTDHAEVAKAATEKDRTMQRLSPTVGDRRAAR